MYTVRGYQDVMFNKNKTYNSTAKIPITEDIQQFYYIKVLLLDTLTNLMNKEKK